MRTVLDDIYEDISQSGEVLKNSKDYKKLSAKYSDIYEEIYHSLNEEQKEKLSDLWNTEADSEYEIGLAYYKEGFKAGLLLAFECLKE